MTERGGTENRISDNTINGPSFQVGHAGSVQYHATHHHYDRHYPPPSPPAAPQEAPHPWVSEVAAPRLWSRVPEDRDSGPMLAAARDIAAGLGALHDDSERSLTGDPWWDREFAKRFLSHIVQLVCDDTNEDWDFHPVEVMLLTLAPYVSQTLWVRTAAERVGVRPDELGRRGGDDDRVSYEKFCDDGHDRLVRRATLGLTDRPGAESDIGWWLFHQWIDNGLRGTKHHWTAYEDLVGRLALNRPPLWNVFDRNRAGQVLYGLRLPLLEACRLERLDLYKTFTVGGGLHTPQRLRLKRLALLLAVARARALDIPALPDDLVENLGIPHRVDLEELRSVTVERASWNSDHGPMVLEAADCQHEAVVEALRQHVEQVDALLEDVHRAARAGEDLKPLRALPQRALAEGVEPARGDDGRLKFENYSKFQVDPRRVRGLLMGVQLYRSPGLAIRELYQNALDACRYRAARIDYAKKQRRDRTEEDGEAWRGWIRFEQGVKDGREYLECRDNGIGMGESELSRVFARAGTRFTDLTDVRNERSDWEAKGIRMYPVSRFGIGVLSYFMIADEFEVITRKQLDGGSTGDCYKVAIYGPNHLFRIEPFDGPTDAGTIVRLYLKEKAPSCVQELKRLLGFVDFDTSARHGVALTAEWKARSFRLRGDARADGQEALRAHGTQVLGPPGEDGAPPRVVWCESGGGVLVDGILTRPTQRRGVLADPQRGKSRRSLFLERPQDEVLRGAVVNLVGEPAPKLSIDRLEILDDVSGTVEGLLRAAADDLACSTSELLSFDWLGGVASSSPKLADIITEAVMRADRELQLPGGRPFRPAEAGFLPDDARIINWATGEDSRSSTKEVPDHILLWRLLAHGEGARLAELGPEPADVPALLPARPSDTAVFDDHGGWLQVEDWAKPGHVLWVASRAGLTPRQVVRRAEQLHIAVLPADRYPNAEPDPLDLALLSLGLGGEPGWCSTDDPVPLNHFIEAHVRHGASIPKIAERMRWYGFDVSAADGLPERMTEDSLQLLSMGGDGEGGWWTTEAPIPPGHVLSMARRTGRTVADVGEELRRYGLTVADLPELRGPEDLLLLSRDLNGKPAWIGPDETVPYSHLLAAARACHMDVADVAAVLDAYGLSRRTTALNEWSASDRMLIGYSGDMPTLWPNGLVFSWADLLRAAAKLRMSPRAAVDRLRRLGASASLTLPDELDEIDEELLDPSVEIWESRSNDDTAISMNDLLLTARRVKRSPVVVSARLRSYGFDVPRHSRLESDDVRDDLLILSRDLDSRFPWLDSEEPVLLGHICAVSGRLGIPILEAADRLRRLGMNVPDVRDMIRAAREKLPRREEPEPALPES
ncbi:hypothetical protein ACFOZ0_06360 [Streptomyces yaanensis]|uniref:ATP-binding protein n=1 Tax=Streptomyces yaanensis TaxID=1142239 RepID=A0ABV7SBT7_9ACTN|nr:hypothetical protein [Streptomyces sp. CGMCC 4.7035]WNC02426.1 hypothetical protein Q2K21_32620 [Streptomyces sp. CGMCC 4.7035]